MKRQISTTLIGILLFTQFLNAQDKKNSLSVGYGVLTIQDLATIVSDIIITPVSGGTVEATDINGTGAIFLEYSHYWTSHWRFVANGNYTSLKSKFVYTSDQSLYATQKDTYYGLMVGINYHWIGDAVVEIYSGLQAGGCFQHTDQSYISGEKASDNSFLFAFQVTPIGLRVGKAFGGFIEAGVGYKGILDAGLDLRF